MPSGTTLYKKLQKTDSSFNSTMGRIPLRIKIQKDPNPKSSKILFIPV